MSDRKNSEGYSDPTAYQAMMNLEIEELRFKKLLRSIKDVCASLPDADHGELRQHCGV